MSHVLDGGNAPHTETELTNLLATVFRGAPQNDGM